MSEIWGIFTWNITTCLSRSSKKRTTHLDILGKVYDLHQHVVKTCPFCNSTKSRPDRSRVSGLRAEEIGDLVFLDQGSQKLETQLWDSWLSWTEQHPIWQPIHVREPLHQKSFPDLMNGWTLSKWIRRPFVQIGLSIVHMICRYFTECTMWRDFQLDRTPRDQFELTWGYGCSRSFPLHFWIQSLKIWTRPLHLRPHLLCWCVKQQPLETHR